MGALEIFIVVCGLVVVVIFVFRRWFKTLVWREASDQAREMFPVWAAQGPFATGSESALAMRYAWLAVLGDHDKVDNMTENFSRHASAFDADPESWENNRRKALEVDCPKLATYIAEVKRLRAAQA